MNKPKASIGIELKQSKMDVKNFPIVCVGGSAGGLDAYTRLLRNLPANMGIAIVILVVFGYSSGWYLDTYKKKRKALPLLHAAANSLALVCSMISLVNGFLILKKYFLQF